MQGPSWLDSVLGGSEQRTGLAVLLAGLTGCLTPGVAGAADQMSARPMGTDAAANAAASSGGKIVFLRTRPSLRIWVIRPGRGRARRLPPRNVGSDVRFSQNGRQLFWTTFNQGCFAADPAGRGARLLYTPRSLRTYTGCPVASPSGRSLAFTRIATPPPGFSEEEFFAQVVVANRRVRQVRRLRTPMSMSSLAWSPSGRRLAAAGDKVTSTCDPVQCVDTREAALWIVPTSGSAPTAIVPSAEGESFSEPDWSPNGRLIAFTTNTIVNGDVRHQIWSVRPDGSQLRQLTHLARGAASPSFSPDGRRIAFEVYTGKRSKDIAIMRLDGSGFRRLTRDGRSSQPDWAP